MTIDLSLTQLKLTILRILRRFHVIIFVIVVLGGLGVLVILLNGVITKSADTSGYVSPNSNTGFDQKTIDQIGQLGNSESSDLPLENKTVRLNPFIE